MRLAHRGHSDGNVFAARRDDSLVTDEDEDSYLSPLRSGCCIGAASPRLSELAPGAKCGLCQNGVRYPSKPRSNTVVYGDASRHSGVAGNR